MIRAKASAPATVGNAGVGFDILGYAVDVLEDVVEVHVGDPGVRITNITGVVEELPMVAAKNTATAGLVQLVADRRLPYGFDVQIHKGIPRGSGLGGSAASAVAGIVATNAVLDEPLTEEELIHYALIGESVASGAAHPDNVAPCLMGGLVYCGSSPFIKVPVPDGLHVALVHPHVEVNTESARAALPGDLLLRTHVDQSAMLASFLCASYRTDLHRFCEACVDFIAEPYRKQMIPNFEHARFEAFRAGA